MQFRKKIDSSGHKLQCIDSLKQEQLNILEMLRKKAKSPIKGFFPQIMGGDAWLVRLESTWLLTYMSYIACLE